MLVEEVPCGLLKLALQAVCFTQAGADRYITENRHNMTDPRVYVDTLNRNTEMVWIRSYLLSLTEES